tara:strand:- start:2126 stop:2308 length:183 start_codon:yes stop_codon:yes gene_type:complete
MQAGTRYAEPARRCREGSGMQAGTRNAERARRFASQRSGPDAAEGLDDYFSPDGGGATQP